MKHIAIQPPRWLTQGAVYQINPRTFCAEGTISAVTKELPFLASLGMGTVYLCPIFESDPSEDRANWSTRQKKYGTENPKNPYRMNDYFFIDEEYGTMEDLKVFVAESHRLGMRVLLDLVYLHIGPNAPILKRHPEFAQQDAEGKIINSDYNFPYLDFHSPGLREYLWSNMVYFVGEIDVDGFRCDVGDWVPIDFWVEGRRRIQTIKPDAVLINEGRRGETVLAGFDAIYGFAWHDAVYYAFDGSKPVQGIREIDEKYQADFPAATFVLRDIDNHDTVTDWPARTEIVAGHDGMELIHVLNFLMSGIPMVYCGNELADTARVNMFANRFHMGQYEVTDRAIAATEVSKRRQSVVTTLNAWRKASDTLQYGTVTWLDHDQADQVTAFRRDYGDSSVAFLGNIKDTPCVVTLESPLPAGEIRMSSKAKWLAPDRVELEGHGYLAIEKK